MNAVAIEPFDAEYGETDANGQQSWKPCRVVGVHAEPFGASHFVVMVEDGEGVLYPHAVDAVRRWS